MHSYEYVSVRFRELILYQEGYSSLETLLKNRTEQLKILVRDNFTNFVNCKDTMDNIHLVLLRNEDPTVGTTAKLQNSYSGM